MMNPTVQLLKKFVKSTYGGIWSKKMEEELLAKVKGQFSWLDSFGIEYSIEKLVAGCNIQNYENQLIDLRLSVKSKKGRRVEISSISGMKLGTSRGRNTNTNAQSLCLLQDDYWAENPSLLGFTSRLIEIAEYSAEELADDVQFSAALRSCLP